MARSGKATRHPEAARVAPTKLRAAPLEASSGSRRGEGGRRGGGAPEQRPGPAATRSPASAGTVRVFISYAHTDRVVAAALREALAEVDRDRVECFLDYESIQSGEGWRERLEAALAAADWLVCVYTGEQSEFCGYEVGVFTRGKALTASGGDGRLVCLHDVDDLPGLFAASQNCLVKYLPPGVPQAPAHAAPAAWSAEEVRLYRESAVFRFLADFCRYKELWPVRDAAQAERQTQALLAAAKRITLAFEAARASDVKSDTPTQLKLEVAFEAGPPGAAPAEAVPDDAQVTGTFASFALFGLMPPMANKQLPSTTWAELRAACVQRSAANALWMDSLEREMADSMRGRALGTPEAIFSAASDGKLYRPVLVRHVVRYDGTNQFDLVFVQALPRQFLGLRKTSLLLAGLVQASRFRFSFLEEPERVAAAFDDARSDREFGVACKQLRYDLDRIESEAAELGVLDREAFVAAFGAQRRAQAEAFVEGWDEAKVALLARLPDPGAPLTPRARGEARAAVAAFLAAMERENRGFVLAALDAYREEVAR
ncbi:TIR domain-containing protein [Roseomonas sp. GCM10028921]